MIPNPFNIPLQEGAIVSLEARVYNNRFHRFRAYTSTLGDVPVEINQLVGVIKEALAKVNEQAIQSNRIGDIGLAI